MPFDSPHDDEAVIRLPSDNAITINLINGYHRIKAGWTQYRYHNVVAHEVCALGALGIRQASDLDKYIGAITCLSRALGYQFSRSGEIVNFNDSNKTHQNDVLNLYANAIQISRNKPQAFQVFVREFSLDKS